MRAVDTNVVVRLVTNDDARQAKRAAAFFASNEVFLPLTVILETEWVLRYSYGLARGAILRCLRGVLGLPQVTVRDPVEVHRALDLYEKGMDFADALHVLTGLHVGGFATFDAKLVKRAKAAGIAGVASL
jgi:predicted nucleic-acid-binding protein